MDINYNKNEDVIKLLCSSVKTRLAKVHQGGGEKKAADQKEKGKMTVWERVNNLIDPQTEILEIAAFAGEGMYAEHGGCPAGGVVVVLGYVSNRLCVIVANDATVKAGAWFPISAKKNLRAQEISIENNLPIIYLVDSAGVFLPLQDEVFADKEHFGRIFRNNAQMSAKGIVQIAAVMGSCVAGGAYLPAMSDEALIVAKTGSIFLAGSYLVKAAVGEVVDNETLGGADTHTSISGVIDYKCENDAACLKKIRSLVSSIAPARLYGFNRIKSQNSSLDPNEIYGLLPSDRVKPYDMMDIIKRLVDNSQIDWYKEDYGQTLLCGYARVDGWSIGIVANQRKIVKNGKNESQMGGVIYSDSADKAARFIMNCNQKKIPLIFFQDVSGFMVGSRAEHGGIIKDGAKMVNAMANSVVPKFTFIIGNSYGAGNYAMCGKAYDPRLIFAWPTAQIAVMSGASASKTLLQIKVNALKAKGEEISKETEDKLLKEITDKYQEQLSPYYAAARLWVDGIIDPMETRKIISLGIEAANHAFLAKEFNLGVIQT